MLAAEKRFGAAGQEPTEILSRPAGLEGVTICTVSGERATDACPSRMREWLPAGADPIACEWHHQTSEGLITTYPPEFRAWAASLEPDLTAFASASVVKRTRPATANPSALAIANPPDGALYSVDPTLRREFQALPLRVVSPRPTSVTWLVDGAAVGTSSSEKAFDWPLAVGTHQIEARDADGGRAHTSVVVK
jgi:membrane carboxypeptidase/penicillin-binding protein PbpC